MCKRNMTLRIEWCFQTLHRSYSCRWLDKWRQHGVVYRRYMFFFPLFRLGNIHTGAQSDPQNQNAMGHEIAIAVIHRCQILMLLWIILQQWLLDSMTPCGWPYKHVRMKASSLISHKEARWTQWQTAWRKSISERRRGIFPIPRGPRFE